MAFLAVAMPGFAAEFRGVTYFTLCHSLADTMSLKQASLPCCRLTINLRWLRKPGTQNAQARKTPRREEPRRGAVFTTGRMRFYRCGRRVQNTGALLPANTASDRNRNQNRNAELRQPPHAGRRLPPPDRRAPHPHRTPSCQRRSRLRPPPRHAGWSLR